MKLIIFFNLFITLFSATFADGSLKRKSMETEKPGNPNDLNCSVIWDDIAKNHNIRNFGWHEFTYNDGKKEGTNQTENRISIIEKWITQPVDHFHYIQHQTWKMRYLENDQYFDGSGPIFIQLGGEWTIQEHSLQTGLMPKIGFEHGALMYYTEHRYYGKSILFRNITTENLKYLNVDQALADVAYFIEFIKKERNLKNPAVIVFGCSYAGNMAAWMRLKYPHLVKGALASSAPVFAKANFFEYMEVVTASYKKHSEKCLTEIEKALKSVEEMLLTAKGIEAIKNEFKLCDLPVTLTASDYGYLIYTLTNGIVGAVQNNRIHEVCRVMTNQTLGTALQRMTQLYPNNSEGCNHADYGGYICFLKYELWHPIASRTRQWIFQTCTEYGYFQTTDSKKSIFGSFNLTLEYFTQLCQDVYGKEYNENLLNQGIKRTNLMYGGKLPNVRNVLFINGKMDPWHALSILEDLNDSSRSILIDGSSHCTDLYEEEFIDDSDILFARHYIRYIIKYWIEYPNKEFRPETTKTIG